MTYGMFRRERYYQAAIKADDRASDFDIVWITFRELPGQEQSTARLYAILHGFGGVILVKELPRKLAKKSVSTEPVENCC